ncbi:glycosyltransferase family 2 protein [Aliiglaciecola sp. SL4]|uniref:glycosyltransferase family 2 protein n=1 Tax=Aliiglaciecola sp. SL4 TaxID=3239806 RepID=UPI00355B52ED
MDISVVIPAKNEQDNIIPLIKEIVAVLDSNNQFEIVYVDDGSDDNTYSNLCLAASGDYPQVNPIRHKYSVGQSKAIHTGVSYAKGKLIVTLDADGQNNPADIPQLLKEAQKFPVGTDFCIAGYRKNRKDTAWKRMQSKIANNIRSRILGDNTPDTGCGLKIFPKDTFLQLPYFDHMHRFLPALVRRLGGAIVVVAVSHRDRQSGTSKYNMLGRLRVGIVDLLGVMWLQRRSNSALVETIHEQ